MIRHCCTAISRANFIAILFDVKGKRGKMKLTSLNLMNLICLNYNSTIQNALRGNELLMFLPLFDKALHD